MCFQLWKSLETYKVLDYCKTMIWDLSFCKKLSTSNTQEPLIIKWTKNIVFTQDYYYKVTSCKHMSQPSFKMYIKVFFPIAKFQMQFYVSFLHCVRDLGFNICAQTFCKRGCVLYFVELCLTKFLSFCIIVRMSVIVDCKARSHNLLSLWIEPSCVSTCWSKMLNICLKRIMRVNMTYLYNLHSRDWISWIGHWLHISKTKFLILKSNLCHGIVSIV